MSTELLKNAPIHLKDYSRNPLQFIQELLSNRNNTWKPKVDLKSTEEGYLLIADLPGYEKKNIHLHLEENLLTIKGENKLEKKNAKEEYYYHERNSESFHRSIYLPEKIMENDIVNAKLEEGVLTISFEMNLHIKRHKSEIKIN